MIHEPKSFTTAGKMRSPGYVKLIICINEIWEAFKPSIVASSFDQCGITSKSPVDFHNQLRHFVQTEELKSL